MKWFKHYNSAHEGHLVGNLIASQQYDAVTLWWVILEFVSKFESDDARGKCTVPLTRIAKAVNMKPSRCERLLLHISSVSSSDLQVDMDTKPGRNVSFLLRNWLILQETRGGKKVAKKEQKGDRGKKEEVRRKNTLVESNSTDTDAVVKFPPLVEIWNEHCGSLQKVKICNKSRLAKIRAREKDCSLEEWAQVVTRISKSDFCNGSSVSGWRATFDFLIQPNTRAKVLEGQYDNKKTDSAGKMQMIRVDGL
jgi:hypothetical protein